MESDLIQIYEEEDSLLQQGPKEVISKIIRNSTYLDCSPLQVPRSESISQPPSCSTIAEVTSCIRNAETRSFSSFRDSINQDNINYHKPEVLKLNVEPHQMKRKKKNGGCNLRKSLPWDRAFFTEEGVLDPLELSMISGSSSQSRIETLSVIHEDMRESSLSSECPRSSANKVACRSLSKNFSSVRDNMTPVSLAKRKVLSGHDVDKSASKPSSGHRPIVSTSLKRPGYMNTAKTINKELKVSKIPTFRPDPSVLASTAKRVVSGTSKLKQTQATRPVKTGQNLFGSKSSTSSTRSAQSDAKSSLESKSSILKSSFKQSTRNVSRTTLGNNPSTKSLRPLTKSKDSFNVTSDLKFRAAGCALNDHGASQPDVSVSFPQSDCPSVASMHDTQLQSVKPSGLRRPSPSLGFFGQAKSIAQGSIRKGTQFSSCVQSNILGIKKPGGINALCERPPHAPEKVPKMVNDVRSIENMLVLNQRSALQDKIESRIRSTIPKLALKDGYTQISFEPRNNQQQTQGIRNDASQPPYHAEPNNENKFCADYKECQNNENKVLVCGVPCSEAKKNEDYEATRNSDTSKKFRELSRFGTENACFTPHKSPEVQVKCVSGIEDLIDLEVLKEKQYGSLEGNQESLTKLLSDRAILRNGKLERSNGLSYSEVEEQTSDGARDNENNGSHIKRTKLAPSEGFKSDHLINFVKFAPSSGIGSELKGSASLCSTPLVNQGCGKLGHVEDSLPGHMYAQSELDRIASKLDTSNGFLNSVGESEGTHITCQLTPAIQATGGHQINDISEYKDIDDKQCSLLVKNYFATSDLKTEEGIHCFDQADLGTHANCLSDWQERTRLTMSSSLEVDKTSEEDNLREKEFPFLFTIESIWCQESGNFNGGDTQDVEPDIKRELGDPHITCQLTPTTLITGGSGKNEITEYNKDNEAKQCSLLVEKRYSISDLQSIEGIHCSDLAALGAPTNCLSNRQDLTGLTMPSSLEVDPKNNGNPNDPFFNGSLMYRDSENFNSGDTQDAKTNILDAQERGVGSQLQHIEKGIEENVRSKVLVEIAELEFLNGSEKYLVNSAVNNTTPGVIDHPGEHSKELPELQTPGLLVEQVPMAYQGELFPINVQPEELQDGNTLGSIFFSRSLRTPAIQSDVAGVVEKAENLLEDEIESNQFCSHINVRHGSKLIILVDPASMLEQGEKFASNVLPEGTSERITPGGSLNLWEKFDTHENKSNSSFVCTSPAHSTHSVGDVIEKVKYLPENDFVRVTAEISASDPEVLVGKNVFESAVDIPEKSDPLGSELNRVCATTLLAPATHCRDEQVNEKDEYEYLNEDDLNTDDVETNVSVRENDELSGIVVEQTSVSGQREQSASKISHELQERNPTENSLVIFEQSDPSASNFITSIDYSLRALQTESQSSDANEKVEDLQECNQSFVNFKCQVDANFGQLSDLSSLQVEQVCMHNLSEQLGSNTLPKDVQGNNSDPCVSQSNCSMDSTLLIPVGKTLAIDMSEKAEYIQEDENVTCTVEADAVENHKCHATTKFSLDSDLVVEHVSVFMEGEQFASYIPLKELLGKTDLESAIIVTDIYPSADESGGVDTDNGTLVEYHNCHDDLTNWHDGKLSGQATYSRLDFPLRNKDQVSGDINTCSSKLSNEDALQQTNFGLKCGTLSNEAESNISPCRGVPESETQQDSSPAMCISENKQATPPLKVGSDNKSDTFLVKPPLDAVPFSDEWLAAFEAAGEEILTLKSGAVQNSPEQDALPEPGPWSPVKRKKQQAIGPFDCTKFSNQHSM